MHSDNYLIHYGVLGMKWGVRKQQNKLSKAERKEKRRDAVQSRKLRKMHGRYGGLFIPSTASKHRDTENHMYNKYRFKFHDDVKKSGKIKKETVDKFMKEYRRLSLKDVRITKPTENTKKVIDGLAKKRLKDTIKDSKW